MNLNPTSLLLNRVVDSLNGTVLFANPEDSYPLDLPQANVSAWCQSKTNYDALLSRGFDATKLEFSAAWSQATLNHFDHVIIYQPKAKELLDYLLAVTMPHLKIGGKVWLVGDNKSGVKSSYTRLQAYADLPGKVDGAKHCLLYNATKSQASADFVFDSWVKTWSQSVGGQTFTLCSIPGVFGHGKLDNGTRLLLEQLAERCPNLIGYKDGVGDLDALTRIVKGIGDRLVYVGGVPTGGAGGSSAGAAPTTPAAAGGRRRPVPAG